MGLLLLSMMWIGCTGALISLRWRKAAAERRRRFIGRLKAALEPEEVVG